jgi:hypothetical protein
MESQGLVELVLPTDRGLIRQRVYLSRELVPGENV